MIGLLKTNRTVRRFPLARKPLFFAASLFLFPLAGLFAEPLFENSVVSNDLDFIRPSDPSVSFRVVDEGRMRKEMPDRRNDELFADGVVTTSLHYKDGAKVEVRAVSELEKEGTAFEYIEHVGKALGKLPQSLRVKLSHVVIHAGDETAFAEEEGHFFVLYSRNIDRRLSTHDLDETVFHETIHATLESDHAGAAGWLAAQASDPGYVTHYAERKSEQEDLPESALFAYTIIKYPGRLPDEIEAAVQKIMPNRLEYFRKLFASLGVEASP